MVAVLLQHWAHSGCSEWSGHELREIAWLAVRVGQIVF